MSLVDSPLVWLATQLGLVASNHLELRRAYDMPRIQGKGAEATFGLELNKHINSIASGGMLEVLSLEHGCNLDGEFFGVLVEDSQGGLVRRIFGHQAAIERNDNETFPYHLYMRVGASVLRVAAGIRRHEAARELAEDRALFPIH